jgi:hypothetical protein
MRAPERLRTVASASKPMAPLPLQVSCVRHRLTAYDETPQVATFEQTPAVAAEHALIDAVRSTMADMTYRVYVRWPKQRVTDKTTTDNRDVAMIAFDELLRRPGIEKSGALGVALTEDGRQIEYRVFVSDSTHTSAPQDRRAK